MTDQERGVYDNLVRLAEKKGVPEATARGLALYLVMGVPTGSFLHAVLENNLMESLGRADEFNTAAIKDIVSFLYNHMPALCWGNPTKVHEWPAWCREHRDEVLYLADTAEKL
jgi:hypothetical protein